MEREALKLLEDATRSCNNIDEQRALDALMREVQPAQEPYDQTALELCNVCGWKTLIPDDGCLNCERAQPAQETEILTIAYQSGYHDGKKAALAGREWNFCERCGKRTADLTIIHTCTPPQGDA